MLTSIVAAALRGRALVLLAVVILVGGAAFCGSNLDIEAYPNPVPPMIEVIAQPSGLGAEEVEKLVTVPLEVALGGMPGLEHVRSESLFGLSDVKCYFKWGTDYTAARQEVINRLTFADLPSGVQAQLSPWNAIGEIYRYTLEGKGHSLLELKTAQDFVIERQLRQVPGVGDVTSFGGETEQYHVTIDPVRLRASGVSLNQLISALQNTSVSAGGQRISIGAQSYDVRGVGMTHDPKDIENVVLSTPASHATGGGMVPIRVRDVATVEIGPAPRLGVVGMDENDDVVEGVVLMRWGASTKPTLDGVHAKIEQIRAQHLLPPGVEIRPYYDRGGLVQTTTHTVAENLVVGMMLVAGVLFVFLGSGRAALVTALIVPLGLACAIVGLVTTNTSANLLSIGAIDFGIVVDSSVVMIEGICRRLGERDGGSRLERILAGVNDVAVPMTFSTLIIGFSFLPLFTMTGVAGVIFSPMAKTYAFAIGGAIVLALTLVPVLAYLLLKTVREDDNLPMRIVRKAFRPLLDFGLTRPRRALFVAILPIVFALALIPRLGGEFMPKLEEGNIWLRATLPTSISREEAQTYANRMRRIVRARPEVLHAMSQVGRPDDGTDVTGFDDVEIFAPLGDLRGMKTTKETVIHDLDRELEREFPGVVFSYSQMISDNVDEAVAGVKGANSVKVFGPDLATDEATAHDVVKTLSRVRGIDDLGLYATLGQPTIRITPNREADARYGLNAGDVIAMVQAAVGGQAVTRLYDGDRAFDLTLRWAEGSRSSIEEINRLLVTTPDGSQVPIAELAQVERAMGAATVFREDGTRYVPVKFAVRDRDLASTVRDAQAAVAKNVQLPWGSWLTWEGELGELRRAESRLAIILPLTLVCVIGIAYAATRSFADTAIVVANVPLAAAGGVLALYLTHTPLSVAAAMGLVSILGIAVQDAILVTTAFRKHLDDGMSTAEAARTSLESRLRPVLMTTLVAMLGLLPTAMSHAIGAETQRPLALFVIGGALMLVVASRLLLAALLVLVNELRESQPSSILRTES